MECCTSNWCCASSSSSFSCYVDSILALLHTYTRQGSIVHDHVDAELHFILRSVATRHRRQSRRVRQRTNAGMARPLHCNSKQILT